MKKMMTPVLVLAVLASGVFISCGKDKKAAALEDAGFIRCEGIKLPAELTFKEDLYPWYVIRGIK